MRMRSLSDRHHYDMLCAIKSGYFAGRKLTDEERQLNDEEYKFIEDYAMKMVQEVLSDPECKAACDRLYEKQWAYRFD